MRHPMIPQQHGIIFRIFKPLVYPVKSLVPFLDSLNQRLCLIVRRNIIIHIIITELIL